MRARVAIVGRPNVGKSTLFNRLAGRRLALVHDQPGVTRDRREAEGRLGDLLFTIIDTAGFEEAKGVALEARMRAQTEQAVDEADLTLLLFDARAGVTPLDKHFADWIRRRRGGRPVLLLANKCEGGAGATGLAESYSLGLGDPVAVSAEHGEGLGELYRAMTERLPESARDSPADEEAEAAAQPETEVEPRLGDETGAATAAEEKGPLQLIVIGRPNVGKSTLVNRLVGEERVLTGPEAGVTRDAIAIEWNYGGQAIRLIDTAGMRRRAKVTAALEWLAVEDALRALRYCHVAVVTIDATAGLDKQDLKIAGTVIDEGRALVIAANKWDQVDDQPATLKAIVERLEISLPQAKGVAVVPLSALSGRNIDRLMAAVLTAYERWNRRVTTATLNRWLAAAIDAHAPPLLDGRRLKLRYMTQTKARPPTFAIFGGRADRLPDAYSRYLVNGLRERFDLDGVPIRLVLRRGDNPYDKRG